MKSRICKICGREFVPHAPIQKCCSPECMKINQKTLSREHQQKHKEDYRRRSLEQYYRTKELQELQKDPLDDFRLDLKPTCGRASCFECELKDCLDG